MSAEKPIKVDFLFAKRGSGIVSRVNINVETLKWSELVKLVSEMYTEAKGKLDYEDFDHTAYGDMEGL